MQRAGWQTRSGFDIPHEPIGYAEVAVFQAFSPDAVHRRGAILLDLCQQLIPFLNVLQTYIKICQSNT